MIQTISNQIESINKSLAWIQKYKPSDFEQKFPLLVEERRKLRMLKKAAEENPAIAAYGVSQVGKSYLINCMLQKDGEPFRLKADGKSYNFIEEMNPKTNNTEATGVVTRFSSFGKGGNRYSAKYPILMRCLSVSDIIIILCDGYYNDIHDYGYLSEQAVEDMGIMLMERYKNAPKCQSFIISDDIMNIKSYFHDYLKTKAQSFIYKSVFFDKLAYVVERIPEDKWAETFSVLWNNSEYQTKLFNKMTNTLKKLRYSEFVYLPAQSLLHNGVNEDTIMSVQCLNELFLTSPKFFTDAYLKNGDNFTKIEHLTKSEICALCSEIIVKIDEEYLGSNNLYCLDNIKDEKVREKLPPEKSIENGVRLKEIVTDDMNSVGSIFMHNDILDFPGARSRKKLELKTLSADNVLIEVLLRGKVAYLFNMYNKSMLINVLLYCHHAEKNEVTDVPHLLKDWISNYVGRTMEERRETMAATGGISPLFYIGTKFNMDMKLSSEAVANNINSLNNRWNERFYKTLYRECFNVEGSLDKEEQKIFLNWTRPGEHFSNCYLLRDYKYSGPNDSKLYEGEKTSNKRMLLPPEFYKDLRNTFCNNQYVKMFFSHPELSWDVAASIDNDGSLYIIDQLAKVATNMANMRAVEFKRKIYEARHGAYKVVESYYVPTNSEEILEGNIRKARAIFREMDFTCNNDNYYFGHLLQALQLTEKESYTIVHRVMQSPDLNAKVNDFKAYELIRKSCENAGYPIESVKSEEDRWQCLMKTYAFATREEAQDYLNKKNVDPAKLFTGTYKRKLNSCVIADNVFDAWCSGIKSVDFINEFTDEQGFDISVMTSLMDNLVTSSEGLGLRDMMAECIAEYVNVVDIHTANESLLADMLASKVNEFVMDFGFKYLSDETKAKAQKICESHNLPAFRYILKQLPSTYDEKDLTALFNDMSTSPKALLPSFEDNYNKWIEYMFISFVANLDIPDIDFEANNALAVILDQLKAGTVAN